MDSARTKSIQIHPDGKCNQCVEFTKSLAFRTISGHEGKLALERIVAKNRKKHNLGKYDSVLGISGGVDSCYLALAAVSHGFKPLLIHIDNGWNTPLAVSNIEKVVDSLGLDLVTYVLDWEEFSNLQKAFLKASTPDGEIPTDFAIQALLWRAAQDYKVKTILTGMNYLTESGHIPDWSYGHSDWRYVKAISKTFSSVPLKKYPKMSLFDLFKYTYILRIKRVSILNYLEYNRVNAEKTLFETIGWEKYDGKHSESIYTKFYQEYLLPTKFGIDKRVLHLSDLIRAGQLTKNEAKVLLEKEFFSSSASKKNSIKYVLKRLNIDNKEFDDLLRSENKGYSDYPNNSRYVNIVRSFIRQLRRSKLYPY
jgi:N-acetyl sugar amidotransferase